MLVAYDSKLLERWDHTAYQLAAIHNLTVVVINAVTSKARIKPKPPAYFHPYRKHRREGLRITRENFSTLKLLSTALVR